MASSLRRKSGLVFVISVITLIIGNTTFAQNSRPFSYQGHLTDDTGSPVDGVFVMRFSLYEQVDDGSPVWSENHPEVSVAGGNFSVLLGEANPIPLSILELDPLYLEITVGEDPPMSPRIALSDNPRVSISRRIDGDILTERSAIRIHPPEPGTQPGLEIGAFNDSNFVNLGPIHPPEPGMGPVVAINSTPSNGASLLMFNPQPEPPAIGDPWIAMNTGPTTGASLLMFNPQPEPPAYPMLSMNTLTTGSSFEMTSPQFGGAGATLTKPIWQMTADNTGGMLNLYNPVVGAEVPPVLTINSSVGGDAGMYMFNPQPEPPAVGDPWIAMTTGVETGASLVMFNPQPEPPAFPFLEMNANAQGPSFKMTAVQAVGGRLDITNPIIEMKADSANGQITLQKSFLNPTGGPDRTRIQLYSDSLQARVDMFAPSSNNNFAIRMTADANGGMIGVNTAPTNIITVQRNSITDPVADAWTTYSSRRWKTDIRTLDNSLARVLSLRGVSYKWKESGRSDIGLIAEEVGQVIPEIVEYEQNGIDARSVDYTRIVPLLIEATKEQQKTIEQLRSEVTELKAIVDGMVSKEGETRTSYTSAGK